MQAFIKEVFALNQLKNKHWTNKMHSLKWVRLLSCRYQNIIKTITKISNSCPSMAISF